MIDLILMPFANPTLKYLINKLDGISEHGGIELFVCYIKKCKQEAHIFRLLQKLKNWGWSFQ